MLAAQGGVKAAEAREAAIETWGLSESAVPMLDRCKDTLSRGSYEFTFGASDLSGCACMVSKIAARVPVSEYDAISSMTSALIRIGGDRINAEDSRPILDAEKTKYDYTEGTAQRYMNVAGNALGECRKTSAYVETGALERRRQAERDKFEEQRALVEDLVRSGRLTRAEGDERISQSRRTMESRLRSLS